MKKKALMSMTAYAEVSETYSWGKATWQLKSVNHRYFDFNCHLPESLLSLESDIKSFVQEHGVHRGKVSLNLQYQLADQSSVSLSLNQNLLRQLSCLSDEVKSVFPDASTRVFDALNYKGMILFDKVNMLQYKSDLMTLLASCLEQFLLSRQREGETVFSFFEQRLNEVKSLCLQIEKRCPFVAQQNEKRLTDKLNEMNVKWDADRLEQELFWFAQKIDIAEELQRLQAHWAEFNRAVQAGGVVGRRLDFLMQEFNREANTIASKSADVQVTKAAVDIKVALEQMREQVQNVE